MKKMKENASIRDSPKTRKLRYVKTTKGTTAYPSLLFIIIIPAYKESVQTLEETLRVLASHSQARHAYHVSILTKATPSFVVVSNMLQIYLAMEGKEQNSNRKAELLTLSFQESFYRISFTIHPHDIPGEAQGKSSNESWAAKKAFKDYPDEIKENVIMTIMDGKSCSTGCSLEPY